MSTKKKKDKGGKKAMTEEEKALYLQAQKEMDRRKEMTVINFLKDKLKEDERSSVLWLQRLNDGFSALFRLCKSEDQKTQMDVLKHTMERQLDGINNCIKDMTEELREKERQSAQMHQCHLMHIAQLNDLHKKRMSQLQQEWERMIRINKCSRLNREQMSLEHLIQSFNLEATVPEIQDEYEDHLKDMMSSLGFMLESYASIFEENREAVLKKRKETLKERQEAMQRKRLELQEITSQNQRHRENVGRLTKNLDKNRKKLAAVQSMHLSRETNMAKVEEQLVDAEKQNEIIRAKVDRSRARSKKHLTELSNYSDKAVRSLKSVIAQGEGVLRMAVLAKKMEDKMNKADEHQYIVVENQDTDDTVEQEKCDFPELCVLTCLQNVAIEQRKAVRQQRNALLCQNEQLRHQKQDMQNSHHNMEIRGATPCSTARSSKGQGNHAAALGCPSRVSNKVESPLSVCTELSVSPPPTLQRTAHPHFYHKM